MFTYLNLEKIVNYIFYFFKLNFIIFNNKFILKFIFIKFLFFLKKIYFFYILNLYKKFFINFYFFLSLNLNKFYFNNLRVNINNNNLLKINPLILLKSRILNLFKILDFKRINSPEIELNKINFHDLNIFNFNDTIDFKSTFYIKNFNLYNLLLRTHTSAVQIRNSFFKKIFFKFFSLGFVYRNDRSSTHLINFNQLEIIIIKKNKNILNLKYFLIKFLYILLKKNFLFRFRNSIFPFTDFSFELDIFYNKIWLEIAGLGIINEKILINMNLNYNLYNGLAIGIGIERILLIIYNIININILYENNIYFFNDYYKILF